MLNWKNTSRQLFLHCLELQTNRSRQNSENVSVFELFSLVEPTRLADSVRTNIFVLSKTVVKNVILQGDLRWSLQGLPVVERSGPGAVSVTGAVLMPVPTMEPLESESRDSSGDNNGKFKAVNVLLCQQSSSGDVFTQLLQVRKPAAGTMSRVSATSPSLNKLNNTNEGNVMKGHGPCGQSSQAPVQTE